jgi:hypothetical protein
MPLSPQEIETIRQAGLALEQARPLAIRAKVLASAIASTIDNLERGNGAVLRSQEPDSLFPVGQQIQALETHLADFFAVSSSIYQAVEELTSLIEAVKALVPEPPEEEEPVDEP